MVFLSKFADSYSELKTHDKSIAGDSNQAHFRFVDYNYNAAWII